MFEFMQVQETASEIAPRLTTRSADGWEIVHIEVSIIGEGLETQTWYDVLLKRRVHGEQTLSTMPVLGE